MMKKIISLLLVVCLLAACCTVFAVDANDKAILSEADALYLLGVFKGTDKGYELEKALTREEGVTMILRVMGLEEEAQKSADKCKFSDVKDWAKGYVGLGFEKGVTKGVSETAFGFGKPLTDAMFLTMILRVLGYKDGTDFEWTAPQELAKKCGLIDSADPNEGFIRADMVDICWRLLGCKPQGSDKTIGEQLVADKAFTDAAYAEAKKVAAGTETLAEAQKVLNPGSGDSGDSGDSGSTTGGGGGGGGFVPPVTPGGDTKIPNYETPEY